MSTNTNKIEIYNTFCNARINELTKQLCTNIHDFDPEVAREDAVLAYEDVLGVSPCEVLSSDDAAELELQLQYMLQMLYTDRLGSKSAAHV